MGNFWPIVNRVIAQADILLLVLDVRYVDQTRHVEVEQKVQKSNKPLIFVLTKVDLVDMEVAQRFKKILKPCVFISATKHLGLTRLRERILIEASRLKKEQVTVGVLGYPNVGKSSLINALKGQRSASTSAVSGHTKGVQKVKADNRIMLLDSPGVLPYEEKNTLKHSLIGAIGPHQVKDPVHVVLQLIEQYKDIASHYNIDQTDSQEILEAIAVQFNYKLKGNAPDTVRASRRILMDIQKGAIHMQHTPSNQEET
ncbi:MAG: GTPase [Candidatus Woesearchaeota archaeon]